MGEASNRYAGLMRSQWEDYKRRFQPDERWLYDNYNNKENVQESLSLANSKIGASFDQADSNRQMGLAQYGLTETPEQAVANDRASALAETSSLSSARNFIRKRAQDRDKEMAVGSLSAGARNASM